MPDHLDASRRFWDGLTGTEGDFARQLDYGRAQWAAAPNWGDWSVPEAARLLRPGGRLIFLTGSPLLALCTPPDGRPAGDRMQRGYADLHRIDVPGFGTEFQLPYGGWVRVLRRSGLLVTA